MSDEIAELKSLTWLQENYHHIWFNRDLTVQEKAGFLAACCDSRRCFLATYSLKDRIAVLNRVLPRSPEP